METMMDLLGVVTFLAICVIAVIFPQAFDTLLLGAVVVGVTLAAIKKRERK